MLILKKSVAEMADRSDSKFVALPESPVDLSRIERVLLVKLSAMGDILHALPVSAALKRSYPHLEIGWAVQSQFVSLVEGNPFLTRIHAVPKLRLGSLGGVNYRREYLASLKDIRAADYELVLDLQGLTKSALVAVASGAKFRYGYHWLRELARAVETPVPHNPASAHIVEQYLDVARHFGAKTDPVQFPFFISPQDRDTVSGLLYAGGIEAETPFLSVNPASAQPLKQWGAARFAAVMDAVRRDTGSPAVLVTADRGVAAEVANAAQLPFVNLAGKTSLKQLGSVIQRSTVHLCGDTGSAHLAASLGVPALTLVGPTDPDRICPYGQRENVLSHKEVCDPQCNWHHCKFPHARCLAAISEREVIERVLALMEPFGIGNLETVS